MNVKIGFKADGSVTVRDAPADPPDYDVPYGRVALTEAQASIAVSIFGWKRVGTSNGYVEVERTKKEWQAKNGVTNLRQH